MADEHPSLEIVVYPGIETSESHLSPCPPETTSVAVEQPDKVSVTNNSKEPEKSDTLEQPSTTIPSVSVPLISQQIITSGINHGDFL